MLIVMLPSPSRLVPFMVPSSATLGGGNLVIIIIERRKRKGGEQSDYRLALSQSNCRRLSYKVILR